MAENAKLLAKFLNDYPSKGSQPPVEHLEEIKEFYLTLLVHNWFKMQYPSIAALRNPLQQMISLELFQFFLKSLSPNQMENVTDFFLDTFESSIIALENLWPCATRAIRRKTVTKAKRKQSPSKSDQQVKEELISLSAFFKVESKMNSTQSECVLKPSSFVKLFYDDTTRGKTKGEMVDYDVYYLRKYSFLKEFDQLLQGIPEPERVSHTIVALVEGQRSGRFNDETELSAIVAEEPTAYDDWVRNSRVMQDLSVLPLAHDSVGLTDGISLDTNSQCSTPSNEYVPMNAQEFLETIRSRLELLKLHYGASLSVRSILDNRVQPPKFAKDWNAYYNIIPQYKQTVGEETNFLALLAMGRFAAPAFRVNPPIPHCVTASTERKVNPPRDKGASPARTRIVLSPLIDVSPISLQAEQLDDSSLKCSFLDDLAVGLWKPASLIEDARTSNRSGTLQSIPKLTLEPPINTTSILGEVRDMPSFVDRTNPTEQSKDISFVNRLDQLQPRPPSVIEEVRDIQSSHVSSVFAIEGGAPGDIHSFAELVASSNIREGSIDMQPFVGSRDLGTLEDTPHLIIDELPTKNWYNILRIRNSKNRDPDYVVSTIPTRRNRRRKGKRVIKPNTAVPEPESVSAVPQPPSEELQDLILNNLDELVAIGDSLQAVGEGNLHSLVCSSPVLPRTDQENQKGRAFHSERLEDTKEFGKTLFDVLNVIIAKESVPFKEIVPTGMSRLEAARVFAICLDLQNMGLIDVNDDMGLIKDIQLKIISL